MRTRSIFAISLFALALTACGGGSGAPAAALNITSLTAPAQIAGGGSGQFTLNFSGGAGPYGIDYVFSLGTVTPNAAGHTVGAGTTTDTLNVEFATTGGTARSGNLTVTIHDISGAVVVQVLDFTVPASIALVEPHIVSTTFLDPTQAAPLALLVQVAGTPTLSATVLIDAPDGLLVEPAGKSVIFDANGNASATFELQTVSVAGGDFSIGVQVDGPLPLGGHDEVQLPINLPQLELEDDTLYAIPLQSTVRVGEPVRILITTGRLAHPFQYMTGVRTTASAASGFEYHWGSHPTDSFNLGAPGGYVADVDGIWSLLGINDGDFLSVEFFPQTVIAGDDLIAIDWNVTPLGGHDVTGASGDLFNFEATFSTAGTWKIGFQQTNVVNRTYYQDGNQAPDYFWGDVSNNHPGVPNSVTVEPLFYNPID